MIETELLVGVASTLDCATQRNACATDSRTNDELDTIEEAYVLITSRVRRSRGEMYSGHDRLCVSVPRRIPRPLHGPGCKLEE